MAAIWFGFSIGISIPTLIKFFPYFSLKSAAPIRQKEIFKMNSDSELTMAINAAFNSIVQEIQLSNLNFMVNMTT